MLRIKKSLKSLLFITLISLFVNSISAINVFSNDTIKYSPLVNKISAGGSFSLVLDQNGEIIAWGRNNLRQCYPPGGKFIDISAGLTHSLALRADGSVVAWGSKSTYDMPSEFKSEVKAISAGGHSLALKTDGSVVSWDSTYKVPSEAKSDVIAISAGITHSLALKNDGSVIAWGSNTYGECNVPLEAKSHIVAISAGAKHSLALKDDGTVVAWGDDSYNQCKIPQNANDIVAISAGSHHSLALKKDGTIIAWGRNYERQCSIPDNAENIRLIDAGDMHSLAVKQDGTVLIWGNSDWLNQKLERENSIISVINALDKLPENAQAASLISDLELLKVLLDNTNNAIKSAYLLFVPQDQIQSLDNYYRIAVTENRIQELSTKPTVFWIDPSAETICEAEYSYIYNAVIKSANANYSGIGYVNNNEYGSYIEWTVNAPYEGTAILNFRYANGSTDNIPMEIEVNGNVLGILDFNTTGDWITWKNQTITANLNKGTNTIRVTLKGSDGGPNTDYLGITMVQSTPYIYGDLNGDKLVNSIDFALLKKYLLGFSIEFPYENGIKAADVNCNGEVDSIDFAILRSYLLGIIKAIPVDAT